MLRRREISQGFWSSPDLAGLPHATRLLFVGLWCMADREGRLEDVPARIHALIFPFEPDLPIDDMLTQLEGGPEPLIRRYVVANRNYIAIPHFLKHQRPHPHEAKSKLPEPDRLV